MMIKTILGDITKITDVDAMDNGIRTIAFPSISTGVFGYPVQEAAGVAARAVREFLEECPDAFDLVEWVLFDKRTLLVYENTASNNG